MSIQIFILSNLMENDSYPYLLKKQISEPIPLDKLVGLTESKLYYHFDSLTKKGLVELVEIIKADHRPDKQVYRITAKGREALPKMIYKVFDTEDEIKDMVVGLANIKYVDRDKVVDILEKKLQKHIDRRETFKTYETLMQVEKNREALADFLGGYVTTRADHNIHWLKELIISVKEGKI
ncbi:PadR family transcriptional regulator [Bacillus altitudinis]|uniref:PadR family transcriptional regulator n=1 Tax=Bacillus altitudinis TaxID=293387 RepID=UPI002281AA02|nr:PadR family transcriptional regulator [Bacillus altitudinis]MCY7688860.1 PadR family transcriptional regulator [Bacillus altitudinis]